ncbi:MAG: septum site-determining protein MinD, partial [Gammaproteobacteria bacterium]
ADAVARFLGEDRPMRFVTPKKQGLLSRILGGGD